MTTIQYRALLTRASALVIGARCACREGERTKAMDWLSQADPILAKLTDIHVLHPLRNRGRDVVAPLGLVLCAVREAKSLCLGLNVDAAARVLHRVHNIPLEIGRRLRGEE